MRFYKGQPGWNKKPFRERFWKYVDRDGPTIPHMSTPCWTWTGSKKTGGYGQMHVDGKALTSSRVAWLTCRGDIPPSLWVLHECDNRLCVNPDHLRLGTRQENIDDMVKRGRRTPTKGIDNPRAILNPELVAQIRWDIHTTTAAYARHFGVSEGCIRDIRKRRSWKEYP